MNKNINGTFLSTLTRLLGKFIASFPVKGPKNKQASSWKVIISLRNGEPLSLYFKDKFLITPEKER